MEDRWNLNGNTGILTVCEGTQSCYDKNYYNHGHTRHRKVATHNKVKKVRKFQFLHMLTPSQAFKLSRHTSSYMTDDVS